MSFHCRECGREYGVEDYLELVSPTALCPSDDCPSNEKKENANV